MGRKKKDARYDRFVSINLYEIAAPAFLALSGNAVKLLVILRGLYQPSQANLVYLSEREAAQRMGVDRRLARKAFAELIERGWIRRELKGSFNCKTRLASSYRLANMPDGSPGSKPTMDYMRWKPET